MEQTFCAECNRSFAKDDMLQLENTWVCAECKPSFLMKLQEGQTIAGHMDYAGFWIRCGAKILDGIVLFVMNMILGIPLMLILGVNPDAANDSGAVVGPILINLLQWVANLAYAVFFLGKYGATPGKMACKLRVVNSDGSKITYGRAFGRFFAEILSSLILGIGYIMVAFDEEKRALHDRICDTRVIRS